MSTSAGLIANGLSLRVNFSWTFVGNVFYAATQWGLLVVLAKLGSPEMVGQFALGLAVTAPIILFTNLHLRAVQATDANSITPFSQFLTLRFITTSIGMIAIASICAFSSYSLSTIGIILLVGITKAFESLSDVHYGLQQKHDRMDNIAKSLMLRGAVSLGFFAGTMQLTGSIYWATASLVVVSGISLALYDVPKARRILETPDSASINTSSSSFTAVAILRLTWFTLPLGIVGTLNSLTTNIPRYVIEHELGTASLGLFAAIAYLASAGNTVVNALGQSALSRLSRYYQSGNLSAYLHLLLRLLAIGGLLGGMAIIAVELGGHRILTAVYQHEYAQEDVFLYLMIAAGISYLASILGYGMTAARYFKIQVPMFVVVVGVTTWSCSVMVPRAGLNGAGVALIVAAALQFILSASVVSYATFRARKENTTGAAKWSQAIQTSEDI